MTDDGGKATSPVFRYKRLFYTGTHKSWRSILLRYQSEAMERSKFWGRWKTFEKEKRKAILREERNFKFSHHNFYQGDISGSTHLHACKMIENSLIGLTFSSFLVKLIDELFELNAWLSVLTRTGHQRAIGGNCHTEKFDQECTQS